MVAFQKTSISIIDESLCQSCAAMGFLTWRRATYFGGFQLCSMEASKIATGAYPCTPRLYNLRHAPAWLAASVAPLPALSPGRASHLHVVLFDVCECQLPCCQQIREESTQLRSIRRPVE